MKFEILSNKRKRLIITLTIIGVITIIGITTFSLTRAKYKYTNSIPLIKANVSYQNSDLSIVAIKLKDGSTYTDIDTVPSSGYTLNTTESVCKDKDGATIDTDFTYESGVVKISVIKKGIKCTLVFDTENASQYLIAKGEMINENGYRYEGANPNNYVTFNNETWRIIGVFDITNADTNKTESLVKIIRNESIGSISWDTGGKYGENSWSGSDIESILNGQYYNGQDISYTYRGDYLDYGNVYITGKSINDTSRSMVQRVNWNLGNASTVSATAEAFYNMEKASFTSENVGLMTPSDYGYAVNSASCARTTTLNSYSTTSSCTANNWLYGSASEWTMIPYSNDRNALYLSGNVISSYARNDYGVRPTVCLKSNVKIVNNGKDGSSSKPYDLSLS